MDDMAALDAAVDVLDTYPAACDPPIRRFLRLREGPTPRLAARHDDVDVVQRKCQETEILE
jgi:hypothetical protein